MCATLYRFADTPIYLREDGTFARDGSEGDRILDLSEAPESVGVAYIGNHILRLAEFRSSGVPYYDEPSYKAMKEAVELVGMGVDLVGLAHSLHQWLSGDAPKQDPVMHHLAQLHAEMQKIQDFQLASWVSSREESLAALDAYSFAAIHTVNDLLQTALGARGSTVPQLLEKPLWASRMALAENQSLLAVRQLMKDKPYWMRPYSLAAISVEGDPTLYYTGWQQHIPDRASVDGFKQVWDHRWAFPALLYAISSRVTVLKAYYGVDLELTPSAHQEIKSYISYLSDLWLKMYSGIRQLKFDSYSTAQITKLRSQGHVPVFAVDINGGRFIGGISFLGYFDKPKSWLWTGPLPTADLTMSNGYSEADAKAWVDRISNWAYGYIANAIGLTELLRFASELHVLIDPSRKQPFRNWQRTVDDMLSDERYLRAALMAAHIAELYPELHAGESASRAYYVYDALRVDDGEAAKAVDRCTEDLLRIGRTRRSDSAAFEL
jgi:hypothetical protein